jgi:hypothetical protein
MNSDTTQEDQGSLGACRIISHKLKVKGIDRGACAAASRVRGVRIRASQHRDADASSSIGRRYRERTLVGGLGSHFGDVLVLSG